MTRERRVLKLTASSFILLSIVFAIGHIPAVRSMAISRGLTLIQPAFARTPEASFLEQEAGIAAYVKAGKAIDPGRARAAYRTVERETDSYVIGSVALTEHPTSEDVHVYVRHDGWIMAYYMKDEPASKIIEWPRYSPGKMVTKLETALAQVSGTLGLPLTQVTYYHFQYPHASSLMVIIDSDSFKIAVPSDLVVYERSWSHYVHNLVFHGIIAGYYHYTERSTSSFQIDGQMVNSLHYSGTATGQLGITQLRPDVRHTVTVSGSGERYAGQVYLAIVVIYRQ